MNTHHTLPTSSSRLAMEIGGYSDSKSFVPPATPPRPLAKRALEKFKNIDEGKDYNIYMSGFLKKSSGELGKNHLWEEKYVEVDNGKLQWYESREKRKEKKIEKEMYLPGSFASVQSGNIIRLETDGEVRLFNAPSEALALKWLHTISRFSAVMPITEGYCEKLSGTKKIFELRYLKLSGDGVLKWYKKDEPKSKGAIQLRGEKADVTGTGGNKNIVFVETSQPRTYQFKFVDAEEAKFWLTSFQFYTMKPKLTYTKAKIRNSYKE